MPSDQTEHSHGSLPIILGALGGITLVIFLLALAYLLRKKLKERATSKWQRVGFDGPPQVEARRKRFRSTRQRTIEFSLPNTAPFLITTGPQVNHQRYDSVGKYP